MIPKIIHYVWLSGDPIPLKLQECIESWKNIMPDYEIKCWTKDNFDITKVNFVREACQAKKWAFACDYIRMYAIFTEGGIYLDSDVLVKKPFDIFLTNDFFTSIEFHPNIYTSSNSQDKLDDINLPKSKDMIISGIGIQAAVLGGVKGHIFAKKCMDYYENNNFFLANGSYNDKVIAPTIFVKIAEDFGFKYINETQNLEGNFLVLSSDIFASTRELEKENSYAIHCCAGSWRPIEKSSGFSKIKNALKKYIN